MADAIPDYEVYALRYGTMARTRSMNFLMRDAHDGPMPLDFFVWLLKSGDEAVLIDTGFGPRTARERGRTLDCDPIDSLRLLGVDPATIRDVVITHLHYDHAGNLDKLPAATFHVQDAEVEYATGRCMCHGVLRHAYDVEDVVSLVRHVYAQRVRFHKGRAEIRPGVEVFHVGGHTKGLQSVRVHTKRGWVVLASDAAHYYANMNDANPFTIVYDVAQMLDGHRLCIALADSIDHVVPGHDPLVLQKYPLVAGLDVQIARLHEAPASSDKT
jgi:glyoxylase-like metal-dependent hydrolase (beta-lactamase superfamily II)